MVNLRAAANSATSAVNPNLAAIARIYAGYDKDANYQPVPVYAPDAPVTLQVQALSKREIEHLDSLNISNATRAAYANLQLTGVDRTAQTGGDLLLFEGAIWLVVAVLEGWTTAGWCKVALQRQMDAVGLGSNLDEGDPMDLVMLGDAL